MHPRRRITYWARKLPLKSRDSGLEGYISAGFKVASPQATSYHAERSEAEAVFNTLIAAVQKGGGTATICMWRVFVPTFNALSYQKSISKILNGDIKTRIVWRVEITNGVCSKSIVSKAYKRSVSIPEDESGSHIVQTYPSSRHKDIIDTFMADDSLKELALRSPSPKALTLALRLVEHSRTLSGQKILPWQISYAWSFFHGSARKKSTNES